MFPIGNILNRAYIYFQDFWKCFSIFNKAKQLQLNREQKQNQKKEKEATWALPGSAQPTGQRQSPPTSRQEAGARARRAPATSCFCRRPGDA